MCYVAAWGGNCTPCPPARYGPDHVYHTSSIACWCDSLSAAVSLDLLYNTFHISHSSHWMRLSMYNGTLHTLVTVGTTSSGISDRSVISMYSSLLRHPFKSQHAFWHLHRLHWIRSSYGRSGGAWTAAIYCGTYILVNNTPSEMLECWKETNISYAQPHKGYLHTIVFY